mgnify:CR=1 FL=1|tara:strand:+ start:1077 stop:1466 length:390 start_codon:yes stop_codon:yes gene_type:complete
MIPNKKTKLLIISMAMVSLLLMMFLTVEPEIQYSVDEVMADPENFEGEEIFLRGQVVSTSLSINDNIFNISGYSHDLAVDYSAASLPEGFHEGLTIAVKGKLVKINQEWEIQASEVITGCPSKYETVDN